MRRPRLGPGLTRLALAFGAAASPFAQAQRLATEAAVDTAYAGRYQAECAGCHGANGRSEVPGVPVLAGQPSLYVITQLFLFREGRRGHEAMVALARQMKDADLRGFSSFIGTLPAVPPPPPAEAPDPLRMRLGAQLAHEHKCTFCHGSDLSGGQQVPRIGGQKEEYLRRTLQEFKKGMRPGYTRAMTEALSQVPESDLDTLAHYARHAGQQ